MAGTEHAVRSGLLAQRGVAPIERRTVTGRLDGDFGGKRFGDTGYAREELVAELGTAFLCADLGITPSRARTMPRTWRTGSKSSARRSARSSPPLRTRSALWTSSMASRRARTSSRSAMQQKLELSEADACGRVGVGRFGELTGRRDGSITRLISILEEEAARKR